MDNQMNQNRAHTAAPSPLGALYRIEARRFTRRWPHLNRRQRAYWVTLTLARIFLDASTDDLAQALREGEAACGDADNHQGEALAHIVAAALTAART